MIEQGHYSLAVVVAHMACEFAAERTVSNAFARRKVEYLEPSVVDFFPSYNLSNDRVRAVYTALSGDIIQNEKFWSEYQASVKRRNKLVHAQLKASKADAEASLAACSSFIAHLSGVMNSPATPVED